MELKEKPRRNRVNCSICNKFNFIENEISEQRIKCQRYYDGETDIGYEDGRSRELLPKSETL